MLTLDLPAEPYWLDLPRGVRVEIRPVTTAVMAAAQAAAARRLAAIRLAAIRLADPDLDPDMSRGLSFAFLVKALARHGVTAWELGEDRRNELVGSSTDVRLAPSTGVLGSNGMVRLGSASPRPR